MKTIKIIPATIVQYELAVKALAQWRNEAKEVSLDNKENTGFAFLINPAESRIIDADRVSKK